MRRSRARRKRRGVSCVRRVGADSSATACLVIEPGEPGSGYRFENRIVGGAIPREYIPAVNKGAEEALHTGVIAGYPVMDVKVAVVDGSFHAVDSSEMAFKIAGSMAVKDALTKAGPILLEPVMDMQVITPGEYLGEVLADLNSRRGRIRSMEGQGDTQVLEADVPLVEMFGYATDLRSVTQGRANYSMEFGRYEKAPESTVQAVAPERVGECGVVEQTARVRGGQPAGTGQKVRIILRAFDHKLVDQSSGQIVEAAERTGAAVSGPVPLPTRIKRFCVIRSPHIDKDSREHFELRTHKRLVDILDPNPKTIDALTRLQMPAGVDISIKL